MYFEQFHGKITMLLVDNIIDILIVPALEKYPLLISARTSRQPEKIVTTVTNNAFTVIQSCDRFWVAKWKNTIQFWSKSLP